MGRLCGERETAQALRAPAGRKKRVSPHPAPKHLKPPRTTPKCHAPPRQPQPARASPQPAAHPAPSPSLPRIYPRIYAPLPDRFGCPAARVRSCRSRRAPAPATSSRSQPTAARPAPSPHLRRPFRAYILGYTSLSPTGSDAPPRASAPAAAGASRPLALRRGQEGSAPSPAGKAHPAPTFSAAPTSAQPPFSSRSRSPWHTAPRRWYGCHGRDTAAGRARFGRGRIRSG